MTMAPVSQRRRHTAKDENWLILYGSWVAGTQLSPTSRGCQSRDPPRGLLALAALGPVESSFLPWDWRSTTNRVRTVLQETGQEKGDRRLRNTAVPTVGVYFIASGRQGNQKTFQHKYLHRSQMRSPLPPSSFLTLDDLLKDSVSRL